MRTPSCLPEASREQTDIASWLHGTQAVVLFVIGSWSVLGRALPIVRRESEGKKSTMYV